MAKRLSMVTTNESFSSFSPIREEPEEGSTGEKLYNLRPKRISFSSTPKKPQTLRYASCSNLADFNSTYFYIFNCVFCIDFTDKKLNFLICL